MSITIDKINDVLVAQLEFPLPIEIKVEGHVDPGEHAIGTVIDYSGGLPTLYPGHPTDSTAYIIKWGDPDMAGTQAGALPSKDGLLVLIESAEDPNKFDSLSIDTEAWELKRRRASAHQPRPVIIFPFSNLMVPPSFVALGWFSTGEAVVGRLIHLPEGGAPIVTYGRTLNVGAFWAIEFTGAPAGKNKLRVSRAAGGGNREIEIEVC
jgi:hypothetical protein